MTSQHRDIRHEGDRWTLQEDHQRSDDISIRHWAEKYRWMFLGGAVGVGAAFGSRGQLPGNNREVQEIDAPHPNFDAIASTLKSALLRFAVRKALEKAPSYLERASSTSQSRQWRKWRTGTMKNNDIARSSNSTASEGPYNPLPKAEQMADAASTAVGRTLHRGAEGLEAGARYIDDIGKRNLRGEVTRMMNDHPVVSLALGVGLGFLLGRLVRR